MYAVHITDNNTLIWQPHSPQALQAGQVRIRIAAAGVNRADLMQRAGLYPAPPGYSNILGLECAGEIIEVAEDVTAFSTGMKVCALLAAGGYASEVVCDAGQVLSIPKGVSVHEAAALPEVFATAWMNLYGLADLQIGEKVLIKAGGGGVGTAAIQLCKVFGNPVYVQVGDDDKLKRCLAIGAQGGINRHKQSLHDLSSQGPFDVILDPVAGGALNETLQLMNTDGRLIVIGLMGGTSAEIDVGRVLVKRLKILGSTLRSQPVEIKSQVMQGLFTNVWPKIADGLIKPVIDSVIPIEKVSEAHSLMESNQTFGKIILTLDN